MILLTGACGLLGSHILEQNRSLLNRPITCQYRKLRPKSFLAQNYSDFNKSAISLDLAKDEIPNSILKGVATIINTVGNTTASSEDISFNDNFLATQRLYKAAAAAGVKRWVQISSIASLCNGSNEKITESSKSEHRNTFYSKFKNESDQWLSDQKLIPQLAIVYPTFMLGEWDSKPSSGGVLIAMKMKKFKNFIESTKNFVSARDVARGIWEVVNRNFEGEVILGGHNLLISDFVKSVIQKLNLPNDFFQLHSKSSEFRSFSESEVKLIKEFCFSSPVDISYAQEKLNFIPEISFDAMMDETIGFFKKNKMML